LPQTEIIETDYLIVGAGVAGLRAAIELAAAGRVLVVAKDSLEESNSEYAQGGIAAALSDDDEVSLHESDTIAAGDGLCEPEAVSVLVREGPREVERLIEWGAEFDREGGKLVFAREGAHSRSRVLHAHGDSTGREIARTLYRKAASLERVSFRSFAAVAGLAMLEGRVTGALALSGMGGDTAEIRARAVLLATGGLGQLYETTTNPEVATGDGVAMAWRAGAWIRDIEFVQFHPTALKLEGAPSFLISEALRGEGARLLNARGERFMERYDARGELAPRDVVARSMVAEMALTGRNHVLLDISGRGDFVRRRFPRIHATCLRCGIDLDRQPAPVAPAAHYAMGGVETDLWGRTDVPGLWAAGEVASTGVHGANRLASNSLLEGIVFGARAGLAMEEAPAARTAPGETEPIAAPECAASEIRALASRSCGITRDEAGLSSALIAVDSLKRVPLMPLTRGGVETANLATLLRLIASAALARQESRGAHYRADFPQKSPPPRHSRQKRNSAGVTLE
jgi:L-aspartate oxidase